jgi:hypothetical protein
MFGLENIPNIVPQWLEIVRIINSLGQRRPELDTDIGYAYHEINTPEKKFNVKVFQDFLRSDTSNIKPRFKRWFGCTLFSFWVDFNLFSSVVTFGTRCMAVSERMQQRKVINFDVIYVVRGCKKW